MQGTLDTCRCEGSLRRQPEITHVTSSFVCTENTTWQCSLFRREPWLDSCLVLKYFLNVSTKNLPIGLLSSVKPTTSMYRGRFRELSYNKLCYSWIPAVAEGDKNYTAITIYTIVNISTLLFEMIDESMGRAVMTVEDAIRLYSL